jgi:hypothetical protein
MTEAYVHIAGHRITNLALTIGNVGPWVAEVTFEGAPELEGQVTLEVGTRKLVGTIDPEASGTFGLRRRVRLVAGAGGWGKLVPAKSYHNDAGVKARTVADDAARAVGEQIGSFVPLSERIAADYLREARTASCALEDALGGRGEVPWWVDDAGITHAGPRPAVEVASSAYQVLAYDPRERIATLAVDDPAAVGIGTILSERLDGPQTVREIVLTVTPEELRVRAWCGGGDATPGRLAGLFRGLVDRVSDGKLFGKYRYRVARMNGQRVDLQAVRKRPGLPDVLPASMWPGVPGAHAQLAVGAEVLVEFIEGHRGMPIVTAFVGAGGDGFVPTSLTLGGDSGAPVARQGDAVEVLLPPAVFSGTIGGSPASGVLTFPLNKTSGVITAGSSKVKAAS